MATHTKLSGCSKGLARTGGYVVAMTTTAPDKQARPERPESVVAPARAAGRPTGARPDGRRRQIAPAIPLVDIVLPVYNEQDDLAQSTTALVDYLRRKFPFRWQVTIADNASTDGTWRIAESLAESVPGVRAVRLEQKGRGRALRAAWSVDDADVYVYMDVDLSTDLAALLPLVAPLVSGHSDLAIGTRLDRRSRVVRGPKREVISRGYNLLTRLVLGARFSDAQCGFKAIRADAARRLLPLVEDDAWFFDTELLVLAERAGLRIHEVPVDWVDDADSCVEIVPTALADLKGIGRLLRSDTGYPAAAAQRPPLLQRLVTFCLIGAASTAAYAVLYLALRATLPAQVANALSLLLTAIANTAANRRLTFGVRSAGGRLRHQGQGLVVFALGLVVTSGSLALLQRIEPSASHTVELVVLLAASVVATLLRFVLFQVWIFPERQHAEDAGTPVRTEVGATSPATGSRSIEATGREAPLSSTARHQQAKVAS